MRRYSESEVLDSQIAERFPIELWLDDGGSVTLTPLVASDWELFERFISALPEDERQMIAQEGFTSGRVLYWCSRMNYEHVLPVVAWSGDSIVGYAALEQRLDAWEGKAGKFHVVVSPKHRGRGIGWAIIREMMAIATTLELSELQTKCSRNQVRGLALLKEFGFRQRRLVSRYWSIDENAAAKYPVQLYLDLSSRLSA